MDAPWHDLSRRPFLPTRVPSELVQSAPRPFPRPLQEESSDLCSARRTRLAASSKESSESLCHLRDADAPYLTLHAATFELVGELRIVGIDAGYVPRLCIVHDV